MTKVATLAVVGALGFLAVLEPPIALPDDPGPGLTVPVRTVTRTVEARVEGLDVRAWHARAVRNRRALNRAHRELGRLRRVQARRWAPVTSYALQLAHAVYGVPLSDLRRVSYCESRFDPFAVNGRYRGLFQEGPMFERGPFARFGVYDPIANALTAAYTVSREGWGQWQCR